MDIVGIVSCTKIPKAIRGFVEQKLERRIMKYNVVRTGTFHVHPTWHDADYEWWQLFKLTPEGAEITGFGLEKNGWCESAMNTNMAPTPEGEAEVPEGFVMVCVGTYPKRCTIYTRPTTHIAPNGQVTRLLEQNEYSAAEVAAGL